MTEIRPELMDAFLTIPSRSSSMSLTSYMDDEDSFESEIRFSSHSKTVKSKESDKLSPPYVCDTFSSPLTPLVIQSDLISHNLEGNNLINIINL